MDFLRAVFRQNRAIIITAIICSAGLYGAIQYKKLQINKVMSARDQCVSNLRGIADMNGEKQDFKVVQISKGEFTEQPDGGVKCVIQFGIMVKLKPDSEISLPALSRTYKGEVFGNGKVSPVSEISDNFSGYRN